MSEVVIVKLTEADRVELRTQHAHRFPMVARVVEDGCAFDVVIGNPSAVSVAAGEEPDDSWRELLVSVFQLDEATRGLEKRVLRDVVLWPAPKVLAEWLDRWPMLSTKLALKAQEKSALKAKVLTPSKGDDLPVPLEPILRAARFGKWYQVAIAGKVYAFVTSSPNAAQWDAWKQNISEEGADVWAHIKEMYGLAIRGFVLLDDPLSLIDPQDMIKRYPGVVLPTLNAVSAAIGATAEIALGEL